MKRNNEDMTGRLVRPPGWDKSSTSRDSFDDNNKETHTDDDSPPARKILKRLLEEEVQRAMFELNEDMPVVKTKVHRAASLIPEFDPDGDECTTVTAWLKKIDQLGEIHGWNDTTKAFHLQDKLRGQARRWYNRLDDYDYSWTDWKQMLTRAFPRHRDYGNMLDEMMNRKKLATESMTKYYQDKVAMCFRCKLSDSATVSCIIRGLPSSLQANARAYQCDRPEDLYEGFLCALDDYQPPSYNSRPPNRDNNRPSADKKTFNPDVDPCPRCKKTGHTLRDCAQPDQRICFKCGKQGHIAPRCPTTSASKPTTTKTDDGIKEIKFIQNHNHIYEKVAKINGIHVKAYLDTGSAVNVLSMPVSRLLNLQVTPTNDHLKVFSGHHLPSLGKVSFQLEIDGIPLHCEAHLTDVDMGGINLLIGQPIINGDGMTLLVSKGKANLTLDPFTQHINVVEERIRFKVVAAAEECLLPGSSIIKVNVVDNSENNDVVTSPQHFDLAGVSYSIPATMLRGTTGYIKIINTGSQNIVWHKGHVLTRADSCDAPPTPTVENNTEVSTDNENGVENDSQETEETQQQRQHETRQETQQEPRQETQQETRQDTLQETQQETPQFTPPIKKAKRSKLSQLSDMIKDLRNINDDNANTSICSEETDLDLFGKSVSAQMKTLSEVQAVIAKEKIQSILTQCRLTDLQAKNAHSYGNLQSQNMSSTHWNPRQVFTSFPVSQTCLPPAQSPTDTSSSSTSFQYSDNTTIFSPVTPYSNDSQDENEQDLIQFAFNNA